MKLQINDAGSWRHIVAFNAIDETGVRKTAAKFVAVVNERASLRILDDKGNVRAICRAPDFDWQEKALP